MNLQNYLSTIKLGNTDLKKVVAHFLIYVLGYAIMGGVIFTMHLHLGAYNQVVQLAGGLILDSLRKALDGQVQ